MPNHDLRTLPTHQHLRAVGGLLLGALCAFQVSAQEFGSSLGYVPNGTGGGSYVKFGSGTKMINMPNGNVSAFLDSAAGSKGLEIRGAAALPVGTAGRSVAVAVTGKVSAVAVASVVGKLASLAVNPYLGLGLIAAPIIYDWFQRSGVKVEPDGTFSKKSVSGGSGWTLNGSTYGFPNSDPNIFWQSMIDNWYGPGKNPSCSVAADGMSAGCTSTYNNQIIYASIPGGASSVSATLADVQAQLATVQPDPAILHELFTIDQTGQYSDQLLKDLSITNVVASGPATVPGPSTTTDTPAQNGQPAKSTTEQTDYNCVYVLADVTCTDKKTTTEKVTTTDPATGAQTVKTTTSTATAEAKPKTDTPDPCIANPERNGCRTDTFDVPAGDIPKSSKTMTFQAENLGFAGGSCPANKTLVIGGRSVTVVDWVENCGYITTYAKPMILAMAIFAGLMIIFGGGAKVES